MWRRDTDNKSGQRTFKGQYVQNYLCTVSNCEYQLYFFVVSAILTNIKTYISANVEYLFIIWENAK